MKKLVLFLFLATVGTGASNTCVNQVTKFVPDETFKYKLERDTYLPLSANKTRYSCNEFSEDNAQYGSMGYDLGKMFSTIISESYMPALNSGPKDENGYYKGCYKDGRSYCCSEGVKYYIIRKAKICEKMNGEYVEDGGYWISYDDQTKDNAKFVKVAAIVDYGCNQQARGKEVSLRFNGKLYERCRG